MQRVKKSALDYIHHAKIFRHASFEKFFDEEILKKEITDTFGKIENKHKLDDKYQSTLGVMIAPSAIAAMACLLLNQYEFNLIIIFLISFLSSKDFNSPSILSAE